MAKELVPSGLWERVSKVLPAHPTHPKGGNEFKDDRLCLRGILFVQRTGIPWSMLPTEAFGVSGSTCWRRLDEWTKAGVWPAVHQMILQELEQAGGIDHSLGVIDSASVRAVFGGRIPDPIQSIGPSVDASGTSSSMPRERC
jgi:transposase